MIRYYKETVKEINIKEYIKKVYYPFYFDEDKYEDIIEEFLNSEKYDMLNEYETNKKKDQLLPEVSNFLFSFSEIETSKPVCIYKMKNENFTHEDGKYSEEAVRVLNNLKDLECVIGKNKKNIPFGISNIKTYLFDDGIGVLSFEMKIKLKNITTTDILDFNAKFELKEFSNKENLTYKDVEVLKEKQISIKYIIEAMLVPMLRESKSFYQRGLIPYHYVEFGEFKDKEEFVESTFGFMYYLMNMFTDINIIEIPQDFIHSHVYMPYGNIAHFYNLKGGGVFVYNNGDSFIKEKKFREDISWNYGTALVLAIYQRIAILKITNELTSIFSKDDFNIRSAYNSNYKNKKSKFIAAKILKETEGVMGKFRFFTARGWCREFSNIEERNMFFTKWQKCFELDTLFEDLRAEIQDINEYLRFRSTMEGSKSRRNYEVFIGTITAIVIPLNLFVGFMGMNVRFNKNSDELLFILDAIIKYFPYILFLCLTIALFIILILMVRNNIDVIKSFNKKIIRKNKKT